MSDKDKIEVIFKFLILIELIIIIIIGTKLNILYKAKNDLTERVKQLEIDYKIYDLNLNELKENRGVKFE